MRKNSSKQHNSNRQPVSSLLLILLAAVLGQLSFIPPAFAEPAANAGSAATANGRVLAFDGVNWFSVDASGGNRLAVTDFDVENKEGLVMSAARYSPDGTRIARPDKAGDRIIHTAADGSDPQIVAEFDPVGALIGGNNKNPFWSPDGSHIAYFSDRNHRWELWVGPADGSNVGSVLLNVTPNGASAFSDIVGDWSPTGAHLAYSFAPPNQLELGVITVVDEAGSPLTSFDGLWPSFSADGSTIAHSNRETGVVELRNVDGSNRRSLATEGAWPSWTPDGRLLAVTLNGDIFTMAANGGDVRVILDDANVNIRPDWSGGSVGAPPAAGTIATANSIDELLAASDYKPSEHGDILRLYRAIFNREADVGGAVYWIDVVYEKGGRSLEEVVGS